MADNEKPDERIQNSNDVDRTKAYIEYMKATKSKENTPSESETGDISDTPVKDEGNIVPQKTGNEKPPSIGR